MHGNTKYNYITDNNLVHRQNYMYSQFCGRDFLDEYVFERKKYIISDGEEGTDECLESETELYTRINKMKQEILNNANKKSIFDQLNKLVQSFEVRKRLYSNMNANWVPEDKNGYYEDYESYLVFAETLNAAYSHTKNLKYLNCLLKLNDTLISIRTSLNHYQCVRMSDSIKNELLYVFELSAGLGVAMGGMEN
ncbi:MAG: hypothetical protein HFH91_02035 [Lachnospiraceae bacterium]|nr:hypothetical protein [Lachnospiraceae bacterium]